VAGSLTYHDPCHVVHGQKIRTQPRALLAQIPGLRVVDLKEADWCCGSAGTYNLTQPEMATRLQERKVGHVRATGADAVITANPGCIIQIAQGLAAQGSPIEVLHIVEILDQAYGGPGPSPRPAPRRGEGGGRGGAPPSPPKGERAG